MLQRQQLPIEQASSTELLSWVMERRTNHPLSGVQIAKAASAVPGGFLFFNRALQYAGRAKPSSPEASCYEKSALLASLAPSTSDCSLAHAICGWLRPPKPQSAP